MERTAACAYICFCIFSENGHHLSHAVKPYISFVSFEVGKPAESKPIKVISAVLANVPTSAGIDSSPTASPSEVQRESYTRTRLFKFVHSVYLVFFCG